MFNLLQTVCLSNSRDGKASLDSVECSGPPTMLSAASPSPFSSRSALQWRRSRRELLTVLGGELSQRLLGHGQHAAGAQALSYSR